MQIMDFLLSLLFDVRAHIPNQPGFGSGPTKMSGSPPLVRAVAAFLIRAAFVATMIWLVVRLAMGFL